MPAFRSPVALSDAITRDLTDRLRLAIVIGSGEDLLYIAADGEVLEVPACGSASDQKFRVDAVMHTSFGPTTPM